MIHKNRETGSAVLFSVEDSRFAVSISAVARIEQAALIKCLPNTLPQIAGVLNYHGTIIPVLDLRALLNIKTREIKPSDKFIVIKNGGIQFIITADSIEGTFICNTYQDTYNLFKGEDIQMSALTKNGSDIVIFLKPEKLISDADFQKIKAQIEIYKASNQKTD